MKASPVTITPFHLFIAGTTFCNYPAYSFTYVIIVSFFLDVTSRERNFVLFRSFSLCLPSGLTYSRCLENTYWVDKWMNSLGGQGTRILKRECRVYVEFHIYVSIEWELQGQWNSGLNQEGLICPDMVMTGLYPWGDGIYDRALAREGTVRFMF